MKYLNVYIFAASQLPFPMEEYDLNVNLPMELDNVVP